jgi:hypothetical protein
VSESLIANEYIESEDTHTTRQSQILTAFRLKRFVQFKQTIQNTLYLLQSLNSLTVLLETILDHNSTVYLHHVLPFVS